jgi:hypothetical protein
MTIRAFESGSNNSIHFYSESSLPTSANSSVIATQYSEELVRPDRKIFKSLFTPKTPVAKLNLRDRAAITFSTDLVKTPDTQTLFDYAGGSIDNETTLVRKNILTWTEQFDNVTWQKQNCNILANSAVAPDGTSTADKIQETAVTAPFSVGVAPTMAFNTIHTFSVYMKAAERSFGVLNIYTGAASCWTWYNLANGTVGTVGAGATASIVNVGNGWFRCILTIATAASGSPNVAIWPATANNILSYAGTANSGILIWGAQLEVGRLASAYQTVTASYTIPQHLITTQDPGAHRRNLFTNTELFSDSSWFKANITATQIAGNTWKLIPSTLSSQHYLAFFSFGLLTYQTFSVEIKADGYTTATVEFKDNVSLFILASINLTTGAVTNDTAGITASSTPLGDGWFRFTTVLTSFFTPYSIVLFPNQSAPYIGNGTNGILIRKPQIERGPVATEYERIDAGFFPLDTAVTSVPVASVAPRRNLFGFTEQFDNAAWSKVGLVTLTANTAVAPDGTTTAEAIIATAVSSQHYIMWSEVTSSVPDNTNFTFSCYVKASGKTTASLSIRLKNSTFATIEYNLTTLALTVSTNIVSSSITAVGNGFYRIVMTANSSSGVGAMLPAIADTFNTYTGDTTSGILIWGAQFELGSIATSYQRVDSALFLNENAVAGANTSPTITTQDPGAHRRNLLTNTETTGGWGVSQFVTLTAQGLINTVRGRTTYIKATANGTSDPFMGRNGTTGLIAGRTFTWSVVAWTDSGQPTTATLFMYGATGTEQVKSTNITLTTIPTLYTLTGTFTGAAVSTVLVCRLDLIDNAVNGNYLYATAPQLEVGPIATDYERIDASFFPEDVAVTTSNVTVVAPRINILVGSQDFNNPSYWATQNGTTLTGNTTVAPDGTLTADTALSPTATGSSGFSQFRSLALVPHTASIWLRAGNTTTGNFGVWNLANNIWNPATPFMISGPGAITGTDLMAVSGLSSTQWSRVGLTFTPTVASNAFYFYPERADTGNTGKTVRIWGAQLETGNVATTYQRVDAALTLAENVVDAGNTNPTITTQDPGAHRRNVLVYSQEFDNANWGKASSGTGSIPTVVSNADIAPDGTLTADRVNFSKGAGTTLSDFSIIQQVGSNILGSAYTGSIWLKAATSSDVGKSVLFRHVAGSTPSTTVLTNSWQRISKTEIDGGGVSSQVYIRGSETTDTSVSVLLWGAQLERGSVATEYERIDSAFFPMELATGSAESNIHYDTGSVRSMHYSTGVTTASSVSARAENRERLVVQSTNDKLDMYIINSGQVVERKTNTISISNTTSIVIGTSNSGIKVYADGVETLNNTASIAFFYNQTGNTSVKSQYLPTGSIDSLERKLTFSSGLNGNASAVTLYYTGD